MLAFTKFSTVMLQTRVTELTDLLRYTDAGHRPKIDLERHQIELELQNRELKNAIDDLESSRCAYAELFDSAPFPYFVLDFYGLIVNANFAAAKLLGRQRHCIVGKPFALYLSNSKTATFISYLRGSVKSPTMDFELKPMTEQEIPTKAKFHANFVAVQNQYHVGVIPHDESMKMFLPIERIVLKEPCI